MLQVDKATHSKKLNFSEFLLMVEDTFYISNLKVDNVNTIAKEISVTKIRIIVRYYKINFRLLFINNEIAKVFTLILIHNMS